jgi:YHS domain-containing protein
MKLIPILRILIATCFLSAAYSAEPVNTECPIKGSEIAGKKTSSVEVGFCCEKCKEKFDKAPKDFLKQVAEAAEGKCPVSGKAVSADAKSTIEVGTCCNSCKGKFDAEPKKFLGKLK